MTLAQGNGYGRGRRAAALFIRKLQWRLAGPRSFEEKRLVVYEIVKEYEPRMDTKTDGLPSTTSGAKMLLRFCPVGKTISWDDGHPGARASRPHKAWHSFGHLPRLHPLATAPCLSFGLPNADTADRVASCSIAPKRSGGQRGRMRAGRPRSQAMSARSIESCHGRQAPLNALIREIPWLRHKITLFENATLARIGAV